MGLTWPRSNGWPFIIRAFPILARLGRVTLHARGPEDVVVDTTKGTPPCVKVFVSRGFRQHSVHAAIAERKD